MITQENLDELLKSEDYIKEPSQCNKKKLSAKIHDYLDKCHHINTECNIITAISQDVEQLLTDSKNDSSL